MKSWVAKKGCKALHANAKTKTKTTTPYSHLVQKFPPISKDEKVFMKDLSIIVTQSSTFKYSFE
jgi:hypothetical protein